LAGILPLLQGTALSQAERDLFVTVLRGRGAPRPCESCGTDNWQVGEYLVTPTVVRRKAEGVEPAFDAPVHTSAVLICSHCGNTKLYNVGALGLTSLLKLGTGG
jgi:hypothetical protein